VNSKQYRKALDELGWSQVAAGPHLGVHPRTSQKYANGETKIPKTVELLLEYKLAEEREKKRMLLE
jgi:hypothetical protein